MTCISCGTYRSSFRNQACQDRDTTFQKVVDFFVIHRVLYLQRLQLWWKAFMQFVVKLVKRRHRQSLQIREIIELQIHLHATNTRGAITVGDQMILRESLRVDVVLNRHSGSQFGLASVAGPCEDRSLRRRNVPDVGWRVGCWPGQIRISCHHNAANESPRLASSCVIGERKLASLSPAEFFNLKRAERRPRKVLGYDSRGVSSVWVS